MKNLWSGQWYSRNRLDGVYHHILYDNGFPVLFHTRKEAREYIEKNYGYIKTRDDLREEPHGWRLPVAVKIKLEIVSP